MSNFSAFKWEEQRAESAPRAVSQLEDLNSNKTAARLGSYYSLAKCECLARRVVSPNAARERARHLPFARATSAHREDADGSNASFAFYTLDNGFELESPLCIMFISYLVIDCQKRHFRI